MQSTLRELSQNELQAISGGHVATAASILLVLELPHIFMGIREFTNYITDRCINGFNNVDENDHFTQFFAYLFGSSTTPAEK